MAHFMYRVCRVYRIYGVNRLHRVFRLHKVHKVLRVYIHNLFYLVQVTPSPSFSPTPVIPDPVVYS